jgi:flagellar biosynthetic protein FlhB
MRNSEGDPHVKGRIRKLQREMAERRMVQEVPKAYVVITNLTHARGRLPQERPPEDACAGDGGEGL